MSVGFIVSPHAVSISITFLGPRNPQVPSDVLGVFVDSIGSKNSLENVPTEVEYQLSQRPNRK